ncbi:cytochrome b5, partial [Rozella allomycis CSF55]
MGHFGYIFKFRSIQTESQTKLAIFSKEEFGNKIKAGSKWVIHEDLIYDVGDFSQQHPGGSEILVNQIGTDITKAFSGQVNETGKRHVHSRFAVAKLGE